VEPLEPEPDSLPAALGVSDIPAHAALLASLLAAWAKWETLDASFLRAACIVFDEPPPLDEDALNGWLAVARLDDPVLLAEDASLVVDSDLLLTEVDPFLGAEADA